MFERLIRFAIEQRWLVIFVTLGVAAIGVYNYTRLAIDAVPDITNVQVQINVGAPGYSPLETEQRITYPIETVMAGLPGLQQTRSLSRYGLSQVTVIFKDGTDIYFARQLVNQRLQEAKESLPEGITPTMGPISTGLGEIYLWTVEAEPGATKEDGTPYTPTDLREIQDWVIKPQLRNITGVTEINSIGGFAKEYQVAPNTERLASYGLSLTDIDVYKRQAVARRVDAVAHQPQVLRAEGRPAHAIEGVLADADDAIGRQHGAQPRAQAAGMAAIVLGVDDERPRRPQAGGRQHAQAMVRRAIDVDHVERLGPQ